MTPLRNTVTRTAGYNRLKIINRPVIVLPLITFIVFAAASVAAYYISQVSVNNTRQKTIERRVQENTLKLSSSITAYTLIASGATGFAESSDVSESGWGSFVSAYDIKDNFPAINAVTYAKVVDKDTAQAFIDSRNQINGSNALSLNPAKPGTEPYIIVTYVSPSVPAFAKRLGIDEYAVASRKQTIDRAISANAPALTNSPQMIQPSDDSSASMKPGFIIFAPIYDKSMPLDTKQERRAALRGTANVSFQTTEFFDNIYSDSEKQSRTFLTVYQGDGQSAPTIYSGGVHPATRDKIVYVQNVRYEDQTFTYRYEFSDSDLLTFAERSRPTAFLLAGLISGALLAVTMLFSIRARLRGISLDKEHEVQLAKDELLSLASHQLRTPATGVKQYMGMVLQGFAGDITEQQKDFLQKAYDSNDRQLHIINDILHLAKLDAGRIVLTKTTFNMSELVTSVVEELNSSAHEGNVTVEEKLPKHMEVYADEHMMRMVVENLISNAIKYTQPKGLITVTLRTVKGRYELAVKDTGVGIADSDMNKLFKQFSRVANERSHLVSGTGVGLYLVKNLVELHGGSVAVTSRPSKGTTFTIIFPHET